MEVSKQLIIGLLIGLLVGAGVIFVLTQFGDLQTQIRDLQSQVSQLQEENSQLRNSTPTPIPTSPSPTPLTTPSPSPSPNPSLGGSFTKFEKVEFLTAYAGTESNGNFTLTLNLKNTGSAIATIQADQILYNGKPASAYGTQYGPTFAPWCNATVIVMNPGQSNCTTISLLGTGATPWISGMTCEVTLHTTGGRDYPKALIIP
jgi:hypothetical protein